MPNAPLTRAPQRPVPGQPLLGELQLARARVHEAHGPARHMFAMLLARAMTGPVFWISPDWEADGLYPPAMAALGVDPGRILLARARHAADILWTIEEILRAGAVPLVVGELPGPPELTPVRRMQLAAEEGAGIGTAPLGLLLTPEGGTAGAESRWHMAPMLGPEGSLAWALARTRARRDPPQSWTVLSQADGFALTPTA